jgi:RimJ/RimL family protein N-acetyltransferase
MPAPQAEDVTIRRLTPADLTLLTEYFSDLDLETRWARFHGIGPKHPARRFAALDDGVWFIATIASPSTVVAEAGWRRLHDRDSAADIAVSVAPAFQRRGLATRLLAEVARDAEAHGIRSCEARVSPANRAARALLDRLNPDRWTADGPDAIVVTVTATELLAAGAG